MHSRQSGVLSVSNNIHTRLKIVVTCSTCLSARSRVVSSRFGGARERCPGRALLWRTYGGRTRISRRYMRALTQTNARARGYSRGVRECARIFLIRMMLRASREGSRGALRPGPGPGPGPVQPLMKITPACL